jgi:hypothetical protein
MVPDWRHSNTPSNTSRVTLLAPTSLECHTDLCHPPDLARISETYLVPAIIHAINQSSVPIGDLLKSLRYVGVAGPHTQQYTVQYFQGHPAGPNESGMSHRPLSSPRSGTHIP